MDQIKRPLEMTQQHQVTMTNRNLLGVDGVANMDSYDQDKIILQTVAGVLEVKGTKLHVQQLNLEQGKVVLDGEIDSLLYCADSGRRHGKGFFSRLVK
jgi:sporulation protein YabP